MNKKIIWTFSISIIILYVIIIAMVVSYKKKISEFESHVATFQKNVDKYQIKIEKVISSTMLVNEKLDELKGKTEATIELFNKKNINKIETDIEEKLLKKEKIPSNLEIINNPFNIKTNTYKNKD